MAHADGIYPNAEHRKTGLRGMRKNGGPPLQKSSFSFLLNK